MTGTLAAVNGEHYAVPGLTFWGRRVPWAGGDIRVALICSDHRGAIELWTSESWMNSKNVIYRGLGGVEVHSTSPQPGDSVDDAIDGCEIIGGPCFTDGSSLAYSEQFLPLIEAGDSEGVLRLLAYWHRREFGPVEVQS